MSDLFVDITLPNGTTYEQPIGLFINNEWVKSGSGELITALNPSNQKEITKFYAATEDDVDLAVKAARDSYEEVWSKTPATEIGDLFYKLTQLIERDSDIIAAIDALDAGKPLESNAKGDAEQVAEITKFYAGYADKIKGNYLNLGGNKFAIEKNYPYGVVALIVPWNYPIAMASWKLQGALVAGNSVVIKPSEYSSLSLLYFAKLIKEAGFPPGVVNVISGYGATAGAAMAKHLDVDKIGFTGSTRTGQIIQQLASSNLKAVSLECGGKSPCVIFNDANIDEAVKWSSLGIFYNSGQNCTANSRILVEEGIYPEFLKKFKEYSLKTWTVGDPFDGKSTMGPLINDLQYEKVKGYIKHGEEVETLQKLMGDEPVVQKSGYYVNPTIFIDVGEDSKLYQEEIFGPVATITKFNGFKDGLKKANNTIYGLGGSVFTKDIKKGHKFADGIRAGVVMINSSNNEDIRGAFGGFKMSGIGRELGLPGIETYTQTKTIYVNLEEDEQIF